MNTYRQQADITIPEPLPQAVIDEAWSEYVYPRPAVGELADPNPQAGFMRATRVYQQRAREFAAAELESLAKAMDSRPAIYQVTAEDVRARAAQLRGDQPAATPRPANTPDPVLDDRDEQVSR